MCSLSVVNFVVNVPAQSIHSKDCVRNAPSWVSPVELYTLRGKRAVSGHCSTTDRARMDCPKVN